MNWDTPIFFFYMNTWDIRGVFLLLDRAGAFSAQVWPGAPTT